MSSIAFVPVRCGSKSIPFKNIKLFCGKPLVYWNLQELQHTSNIDRIIVATDCKEIEEAILSFGLSKVAVYRRLPENATDRASTESVMLEYLSFNPLNDTDNFILVQATSPLTSREHFNQAVEQYQNGGYDSLLTCVRMKRFMWSEDGVPLNYDYNNRPRRQDFNGFLIENGAFYINKVGNILKTKSRLCGRIAVFEMPEYTFIEIDEEQDWVVAEDLMRKYFKYLNSNSKYNKEKIKLVATDVDGVLTDAGMYYSENGDELKKFNTRDGKGFELLRLKNIKTAIITSENTEMVIRRGNKIKADYVVQGVTGIGKLNELIAICKQEGIELHNCAYIGDDINCIPILEKVGVAFCPADAEQEVKAVNKIIVLPVNGGGGVFREAVKYLLQN